MDLLNGKIRPMYLRLLGTSVGSAIVTSVFGMVDAMMVGQYHGPEGTAALAIFIPVWSFIYSLGIMAGAGGSVLFAHSCGKRERDESDCYFTATLLFGALLAALSMAVLGLFDEPLLHFFGAKGDTRLVSMAQDYLKPVWFAIPACIFNMIQSSFLRNDGEPDLAMKAVLFGGLVNVAGDYIFVFVLDQGIYGAGFATALSLYATNLVMLTHYFKKRNTLRIVKVTAVFCRMRQIAAAGISAAVTDLSMGITTVLMNNQIMRLLGSDALAVYGVIAQFAPFVQSCACGVGQAVQPILSQNYGAGNKARIRECFRYGIYTSAIFGVVWFLGTEVAPNALVHFFMSPTDSILTIAPPILRAYCSSFLLLTFNIFATYFFQALMDPQTSAVVSFGRGLILIGAILILPLLFGPHAIWWAMTVTEGLVALYCGAMIKQHSQNCKE